MTYEIGDAGAVCIGAVVEKARDRIQIGEELVWGWSGELTYRVGVVMWKLIPSLGALE